VIGISVKLPDLAAVEEQALDRARRDITGAMREATEHLKNMLRDQVEEAGMGARIARTWRFEVYPKGRAALNPAGEVWSKAPKIIDAFARGATIRPVNGGKYLWIPTKNVPKKGRNRRMTPEEVESSFNIDFEYVPGRKRGTILAFIIAVQAASGRGFRAASAGRLRGRKGLAPRKAKPVLMFVLVKDVKEPKLFDLDAAAAEGAAYFATLVEG